MKGFIVYPTYKIQDNKAYIYLFGRLENGKSFLTIHHLRPYFYIRTSDKEKALKIVKADYEDTVLKDLSEQQVTKVITNIPKDVPIMKKLLQEQGILCYEADIRFAYRYLVNNDLYGSIEITGNARPDTLVNEVYTEPTIAPSSFFPILKTLSIDIETDTKATTIYCISLYSSDVQKVLLVSEKNIEGADCFSSEKPLLERFVQLVREIDPDIITGWNFIDFDLKIIFERCKKFGVECKIGRIDWDCKLSLEDSFFRDSSADIPGRMVLDGIHLMKISQVKLPDYKLNTAAKIILKKEKLINHSERFQEIERLYVEDPKKLVAYNLFDSQLVYEILEKAKLIELTIRRSMLTRMALDRVNAAIACFDSLYIRELNKRGYVAPTVEVADTNERIKGGFVREPKPGIYDTILVFDFKSLYSSIIRTFNIDPLVYSPPKKRQDYKKEDVIIAPNGAMFKKQEGILPALIQMLWEQRDLAKKQKDTLSSNAIKLLMSSFFGVLANPTCRFYNLEIANAITHFGQFLIKLCADELLKQGYDVIYGDTDSLFVDAHMKEYEKAMQEPEKIQTFINTFLKEYIRTNYGQTSVLELQYEKTFKKFLMPMMRKKEEGAKKRYAGLLEVDGKEKIDFRGLEFVRRDWTEAAKTFQMELLSKIFHNEEISLYVKTFVQDVKAGKYDTQLIYKKALRKDETKYTKTTPPHVQAVRKAGVEMKGIIEYVQTINGPELVEYRKSPIDYQHYIEKQIKPLADSILIFFNKTFNEVIQGSKQKSLMGF